jgi:CRP-like cAMP-binding protein
VQHKLDESLLAPLPPFSKLSRAQIREVLDQAACRRVDKEETIFSEGDQAERFYLLLDGYIRVIRITETGEQVIALHIPPGQLFGIAPAIARTHYPASSVTASESIILSWPTRLGPEFTANYEGFATETYKTVGSRVAEMNNRVLEMATQHVEQRVANALMRLINQTGRKTESGIAVDFPITRQQISELTGTTLHPVSRMLSAWQKQGIVISQRKHIEVRQPEELALLTTAPAQD